MVFAISGGKLTTLDRALPVSTHRISLSSTYAADYAELYRTQPHVRTVISFLARNIGQIGLHTFERVSDTDRRRLSASDSGLAALIAQPYPTKTRYRWLEALVSDLGIYDVACSAKLRRDGRQPAALLRLPPQQVTPKGDSWIDADRIEFRGSKGKTELAMDEVVLIHGYNPSDARWGLSPMETLRQILAEEWHATQYREQLWRNGARFPGHIRRPKEAPAWSPEARERFRNDWRGLYTGDGPGAGGTPVLEDGMTFEGAGITPAQAQYLETRKLTREEVAAAFHIPPPLVGILDHATFSNIEEQHKHLYQDTLGPWLTMIQEELALQLVPEFDDTGKVYVEFNLAEKLKGSFEEQATSLQTAVGAPWLTRNEARARQNLPQIEGGDELVTPLNVIIGGQASPTDSAPKSIIAISTTKPYEAKHTDTLRAFLARQAAAVQSRMGAKSEGAWWDGDRWDTELGRDLFALAAMTASDAAKALLPTFDDADLLPTLALEAKSRAAGINADTKHRLDVDAATAFDTAEERAAKDAAELVGIWVALASSEAQRQAATTP